MFEAEIRKRRVLAMRSSQWRWHHDEIFMKINGERYYLLRAVDHEGEVLESFVTKMRDQKASLKFLRKVIRKHGRPKVIMIDRPRSYGAESKEIGAAGRRKLVAGSTIALRFRTCRSEGGSGQCGAFGGCEVCRSSPPFMPRSTTCSIWSAASIQDQVSRRTAPLLSPSGAIPARHKAQQSCPSGDMFELVCTRRCPRSRRGGSDQARFSGTGNLSSASISARDRVSNIAERIGAALGTV